MKTSMCKLLAGFLLIGQAVLATHAFSQVSATQCTLKGVVGDFVTRSFVGGASVLIDEVGIQRTSDERGEFSVEGLAPGSYTIRIIHPQHRPMVYKNFQLSRGGVHAFFVMKSGRETDSPSIIECKREGQFVIDQDAEVVERREPQYPESALKEKAEGQIVLWVGVTADGEVSQATFKEGSKRKDLLDAAMDAIQYFKFKPAKVKGKGVGVMVVVPFIFKLADATTSFPMRQIYDPLSAQDIASALAYLGVTMERFIYELPYRHDLKVYFVEYAQGKVVQEIGNSFERMQPGKNSLVLYKYDKDWAVEFTLQTVSVNSKRSVRWDKRSTKGFPAQGTARIDKMELKSGSRTPIYALVLSPAGVSFNLEEPVEKIVARAARALAVYVELKLEN